MKSIENKEGLLMFCTSFAEQRVSRISNTITDLNKALQSETKSSAGDKHETGRAMTQLEIEKAGAQLADAEKMLKAAKGVRLDASSNLVGIGNLVKTSMANYFIAISAGVYKENEALVYCISQATPIGQLLKGKKVGESISFNGNKILIEEIL